MSALTARLAAVTQTEVSTEVLLQCTRITVPLPAQLTEPSRRALLAALADADRYGHDVTAQGAVVWAEFDRDRMASVPRSDSTSRTEVKQR